MLDRRITIITGKDSKLMEDYALKALTGIEDVGGSHSVVLNYPEIKKHPKEYIKYVYKYIKEVDSLMIITYSQKIVNFMGILIDEKVISNENIVLKIVEENEVRSYSYSDKGYLEEGYSIDYGLGYFDFDDIEELDN